MSSAMEPLSAIAVPHPTWGVVTIRAGAMVAVLGDDGVRCPDGWYTPVTVALRDGRIVRLWRGPWAGWDHPEGNGLRAELRATRWGMDTPCAALHPLVATERRRGGMALDAVPAARWTFRGRLEHGKAVERWLWPSLGGPGTGGLSAHARREVGRRVGTLPVWDARCAPLPQPPPRSVQPVQGVLL